MSTLAFLLCHLINSSKLSPPVAVPSTVPPIHLWSRVQFFMHPSKTDDIPYLISGFSREPLGDHLTVVDRWAEQKQCSRSSKLCVV
ncbi:hypothetical protein B0H14DRAFT_3538886 [Mycena olivaceomarginata]|nr:hypothetical protein B0H14DRAFT_3538886 [Mycena olivaceomarginata]